MKLAVFDRFRKILLYLDGLCFPLYEVLIIKDDRIVSHGPCDLHRRVGALQDLARMRHFIFL